LLYKVALKPIWSYGVQLWGFAKPSRLKTIERIKSKLLRTTVNAPWYVSNKMIHSDLHISWYVGNQTIHNDLHISSIANEISERSPNTIPRHTTAPTT